MDSDANGRTRPRAGCPLGAPGRGRRLWLTALLGVLVAFGPLSIDMYLPALPLLSKDLHAGTSVTQLSLTATLLGLALGQVVAGSQSDSRGRRGPLLVGLGGYAVSSLLCAASGSICALVAFRFLQGLAGSAGIVISLAVARDLYAGPELTRFLSLLVLVNGVGPVLAPVAGGQLLRVTSWRGVFVVLAAVGLVMFLAVLAGLPETLPRRSRAGLTETLAVFGGLLSDGAFMGYALPQGLVIAAMFAYISGSPFVIQEIFGASPQTFSLVFAINGLGIIAASQVTGLLSGRVRETVLFAGGIGLACTAAIVLLATLRAGAGLVDVLPPLFLVVSSIGIVNTAGSSLALQRYGHAAGSASALLGLISLALGAAAAPLAGLAGKDAALPMGMVIAVADAGAAGCYAAWRWGGRCLRRDPRAPSEGKRTVTGGRGW